MSRELVKNYLITLTLITLPFYVIGYPSGAPTEACDSLSPERGHGVASMPVQYAPFTVIAYGNSYRPGDKIPSK